VNEAERFIYRGTRGLWGKRREEAQGELRSHIYERTQYHLQLGSDEHEALVRALRDLGDPHTLHLGLLRIHSLPLMMALALTGALLTGAISTLVQAQPITVQGGSHDFERVDGVYIRLSDLKAALPGTAQLTVTQANLHVRLPGMVRPVVLQNRFGSVLQQGAYAGNPLVNLVDLARELGQAGVAVNVDGWERPRVHLGSTTLDLAPGTHRTVAAELYWTELLNRTRHWFASPGSRRLGLQRMSPQDIGVIHTLALKARPGEVFALLVPQRVEKMNFSFGAVLAYSISAAGLDGSVTFTLPSLARRLHVTGELRALGQAIDVLNREPDTSALAEAYPAVVVRLDGELSSTAKPLTPVNVNLRSTVP